MLFWVFWAGWPHQSKKTVSTYWRLWCFLACKKSTAFLTSFLRYRKDIINFSGKIFAENLDVYQHAKDKLHRSLLSWDTAKKLHGCYFEYFRHAWLHPSDVTAPTFWILWSLSQQKSTLSLTSFSRYCRDFANLLFWVLWAKLAIFTKIDSIKL